MLSGVMKISYAILTHNDGECVNELLNFLATHKRPADEIVVLDDDSDDELTLKYLNEYKPHIKLSNRKFGLGYAAASQKNHANSLCTGDFILQLDADELVTSEFVELIPELLKQHPKSDLFIMPRITIMEGLTQEWIDKWKWNVNEKGWINFPDWQKRLYRNCNWIRWASWYASAHSKVIGAMKESFLPTEELFSIMHSHNIDKQIFKMELYDRIRLTKLDDIAKKKAKIKCRFVKRPK